MYGLGGVKGILLCVYRLVNRQHVRTSFLSQEHAVESAHHVVSLDGATVWFHWSLH